MQCPCTERWLKQIPLSQIGVQYGDTTICGSWNQQQAHKSSQTQSSVSGSQTLLAHSSGPCAHPLRQYDNNVKHQSSRRNTFSACSSPDTSSVEMGVPQACFTLGSSPAGDAQLSSRLISQATSQFRGVALEPTGCTTNQGPLCHGIGGQVCQEGRLCHCYTATCGSCA